MKCYRVQVVVVVVVVIVVADAVVSAVVISRNSFLLRMSPTRRNTSAANMLFPVFVGPVIAHTTKLQHTGTHDTVTLLHWRPILPII